MVLYLQSAVVMMDCLTVLSIISHTHKHNNNEANILTVQMFGLHMLQFQPWHYRHRIRHGKCCNTARPPKKPKCKPKSQIPVPGVASASTKSHIPGPAQARVPWEWEWPGSRGRSRRA